MADKPTRSARLDSLSDRFSSDLRFSGDKPDSKPFSLSGDFGSPLSPLRHPRSASSSSSSGSGSLSEKPSNNGGSPRSDPCRKSHSAELSPSIETTSPISKATKGPGHRRSGSGPLIYSGSSGGGVSTASSPLIAANVAPCGNIVPSGRITKGAMTMTSRGGATARSDVLGSGSGNYGHGSIVRGGVAASGRSTAAGGDPEEVTRAGNENYKRGLFAEALRFYDRAVSMCPENPSCRGNRAAALAGLGRLAEAVKECEAAVRLDPLNARPHHRLATIHLRLGNVETAREHLFMSGKNPDLVELQKLQEVETHLGRCIDARKVGDWKGALREADAAVAAGANASPLITASRAESLLRLHQLEDSDSVMSSASKFLALSPSSPPQIRFFGLLSDSYFHVVRAQVEMALGRFDSAVVSAERARQIDLSNMEVVLILNNVRVVSRARARGNELFIAGKFGEASIAYEEGLKYDPENPVLYCNRAACRFKTGQWEKSIEDCNEALKIQPNYTKALLRRAASFAKLERWVEAVQDYTVLRKELPEDTEVAEALFHAEIALKTSRGEDVSNAKFGGEVEEATSLEQFQAAVSLQGVSVVHFMSASNPQCVKIGPFVDQLCIRYPSANFLKVDIDENAAVAKSENVRIVPTFKIYKNGTCVKEMICPSQQVLAFSVRHYSL